MTELSRRFLTSLILIPVIIFILIVLPPLGFAILSVGLIAACAWEWSLLMGLRKTNLRLCYMAGLTAIFLMVYCFTFVPLEKFPIYQPAILNFILYIGSIWWLIALVLIIKHNKTGRTDFKNKWIDGSIGILIFVSFGIALNAIRTSILGIELIFLLLILIWSADIAAYFTGKKFGGKKLLSNVSPGKTFAGVYGALFTGILICAAVALILGFSLSLFFSFVLLGIITIVISIIGDLFMSLMKRRQGLKDTGNLLPGHGGLLDRIDSLISATPVFALGLIYHGF